MLDRRHDLAPCSTIGAKLVCDDALGYASLLLHQPDQKTLGSLGVPAYLDDLVEHIAVLVDGTPEPVIAAADCHHDLVQMPYIRWVWRFATQAASIDWPELYCPAADRLIGNDDAGSDSISSTRRRLSGKRKYSQTAWAITAGGKRWRL